jgi:virginiamycin B lyase
MNVAHAPAQVALEPGRLFWPRRSQILLALGTKRKGGVMTRSLNRIVTVFSLFFGIASFSSGATITGTVKGPDGAPFEGAFVQATNTQTKIMVNVLSGRDGHYLADNLSAGEYTLRITAVGYTADLHAGVNLTASSNASHDFKLAKGMVRWSDLSYYQGKQLFPEGKGRKELTTTCFGCHGFETRMASVHRDLDGWRDRVNYMREVTHFATYPELDDQKVTDIAEYINSLFGDAPVLPRSPEDMPKYQSLVRHFTDEAMKIVYVEYEMPGPSRMPFDANPGKSGMVWIPEFGPSNAIARLDPVSGKMVEYKEPETSPAFTHSAVEAPDGTVWFAEQAVNKIGKWDPKTKQITEYQDVVDPTKKGLRSLGAGSKHTVRVDARGNVWATGITPSMFDPKTGKFTDYPFVKFAYGITNDEAGNIWFTDYKPDGKIYKVDGETAEMTGYQPPTAGLPRRIQVDTDGMVWFGEFQAGKIGRFDPKTKTFKEWTLPGPDATPYAFGVDKNHYVWYSSEQLDVMGRLDPTTGEILEYPFPQSETAMRELLPDSQGRLWFATPPNNKVGYFYVVGEKNLGIR